MTIKKALALAFLLTLSSQALDVLVHLAGNIALHIPYMAVKMTVIFFTFFFFYYWIGNKTKDVFLSTAVASVMFYVYYSFAEATLDRTIFTLDGASFFIIIHWFCMIIPALLLNYLVGALPTVFDRSAAFYQKIVVLGLLVGSLLTFPSKKFLKANNLNFGLSYNDHVLIGTLAFIVVIVAVYTLTRCKSAKVK